ncbi:hypothetical protein AN958_03013 [Leucoagaricus sp. SymC.cos]|nr:hypothetical protein AN958_03013 [Leucoagaricus sp. SymC.cos]
MLKVLLAENSITRIALERTKGEKDTSRLTRDEKEMISGLEKRLADYRMFIRALAEGHIVDPRIIYHAQAGIDDARNPVNMLVEAIQAAASDKDSPWSKILPALINDRFSEKYYAVVNMALKLRSDLHTMENLVRYWKSRAMLGSDLLPPGLDSGSSHVENTDMFLKHHSNTLINDLGHISNSGNLQSNRAFKQAIGSNGEPFVSMPPKLIFGRPSIFHPLRPSSSDGMFTSTMNPDQHGQFHTKRSRHVTFHDLFNLKAQNTEKRHGFLMPCIKPILPKQTSTPINIPSFPSESMVRIEDSFMSHLLPLSPEHHFSPSGAFPIALSSPELHRFPLLNSCALQSAERLCATFSSGSLGSLEASLLSDPTCSVLCHSPERSSQPHDLRRVSSSKLIEPIANYGHKHFDNSLQFKIGRTKIAQVNSFSPTLGDMPKMDTTRTPLIPSIRSRQPVIDLPSKLPLTVTAKPIRGDTLALPSAKSTVRALHPLRSSSLQRTIRNHRSTNIALVSRTTTGHHHIPIDETETGSAVIRKQSQCNPTVGCQNDVRKSTPFVKVSYPLSTKSTRLVHLAGAPASAICAPRPSLGFIKSGLAKPAASSPTNSVHVPQPGKRSRMPSMQSSTVSPHAPIRKYNLSGNGPSGGRSLTLDSRNRLRVVNHNGSEQRISAHSPSSSLETRSRAKLWSFDRICVGDKCSEIDSGCRTTGKGLTPSHSGSMRGVGGVARTPCIREGAV